MTKEIPWKNGESLFDKKGGDLTLSAKVDVLDLSDGHVNVYLGFEASSHFRDGSVNQFLQAHEKESRAITTGAAIINEMAQKLKDKGYSIRCSGGIPTAHCGGAGCLDITIEIGGKKNKTDGLQEAIQVAYYEVLRENKSIAAYMSRNQSEERKI